MFLAVMKYKASWPDLEWRITRLSIAKATGWTLDYIDTLSINDVHDFFTHEDVIARLGDKG